MSFIAKTAIWSARPTPAQSPNDKDGNVLRRFDGGNDANHFNNFLQVVRTRRMEDLHAPPSKATIQRC